MFFNILQYRYAIQICNTDMQHKYAIQICNKDMQYRYAIQICNTDMQYRYAIQIYNTDMQYRYAIKICNRDMQYDMQYDNSSSGAGGGRHRIVSHIFPYRTAERFYPTCTRTKKIDISCWGSLLG